MDESLQYLYTGKDVSEVHAKLYEWGSDITNIELYKFLTTLLAESFYYRALFATQFNKKNRLRITESIAQHLQHHTIRFFHELSMEEQEPFCEDAVRELAVRGIVSPTAPEPTVNGTQSQIWPDLPQINKETGQFHFPETKSNDI